MFGRKPTGEDVPSGGTRDKRRAQKRRELTEELRDIRRERAERRQRRQLARLAKKGELSTPEPAPIDAVVEAEGPQAELPAESPSAPPEPLATPSEGTALEAAEPPLDDRAQAKALRRRLKEERRAEKRRLKQERREAKLRAKEERRLARKASKEASSTPRPGDESAEPPPANVPGEPDAGPSEPPGPRSRLRFRRGST